MSSEERATAATIIAQAASEGGREISENALYLIHNSICATEGNAAEITSQIELLRQTDARIAAVYAARSGRPDEEFAALMAENNGNGRWLSPQEAVEAGLADRVIETAVREPASLARNLARGWRRLLAEIGVKPAGQPAADRNILHTADELRELHRRSAVAAQETRQRLSATRVQPCEDPSCGEALRSANERAYAEDAKCFHS